MIREGVGGEEQITIVAGMFPLLGPLLSNPAASSSPVAYCHFVAIRSYVWTLHPFCSET